MSPVSVIPNQYFHVYLPASSPMPLFADETAYQVFLERYRQYIGPVSQTFAYCLLPNHFHFFIRTLSVAEQYENWTLPNGDNWQPFRAADFGAAFQALLADGPHDNIRCIPVRDQSNFQHLIRYIHQNPALHQHHSPFQTWRWSSYKAILRRLPSRISVDTVLSWFSDVEWFEETHWETVDETKIGYLILDD